VGKSQSGKTTQGVELVQHLAKEVDEIIVCSKTFDNQHTWDPIRSKVTVWHDSVAAILKTVNDKIQEEAGDEKHKTGEKVRTKRMLIFDDVSEEKAINAGSKGTYAGLIYNAVWYNMSILTLCHRMEVVSNAMKENAEFALLFNQIRPVEIESYHDNFGITKTKKDFFRFFRDEVQKPIKEGRDKHPFVFYDIKNGGNVYYKFKERLELPEEAEDQ